MPKLPPRPRKLPEGPGAWIFGRRVESPIGIAAGPLANSRWIEAYARLGYGILTYRTVRTAAHPPWPHPNIAYCRLGDPAVTEPAPRKPDPGSVTLAVSTGLPSPDPDEWRNDVMRAKSKLRPGQMLIVSVMGTPSPEGGDEALAEDYARCARWAADAGADALELHLGGPHMNADPAQMLFENPALSAYIADRVRRAVGSRPIVAKLGATRSPRALHELASRLAPRVDGFSLVSAVKRRIVKPDGTQAFAGDSRGMAAVVGAGIFEHCQVQIEELLAWRKAGAWSRAVLAVGGVTTVDRANAALHAGADAAMVATAAIIDPLIAARFVQHGRA